MRVLIALLLGTLFGVGLTVSQMVNPAKVIGFLDVTGHWDPSLAFVMGGALLVTVPVFALLRRRAAPVLEANFTLPTKTELDVRLVGGATMFGLGWGLSGFCPGPALASLGFGDVSTYPFVGAMILGTFVVRWLDSRPRERTPGEALEPA